MFYTLILKCFKMLLGNCCHAKLRTYPRHIANVTGRDPLNTCPGSCVLSFSARTRLYGHNRKSVELCPCLDCIATLHPSWPLGPPDRHDACVLIALVASVRLCIGSDLTES